MSVEMKSKSNQKYNLGGTHLVISHSANVGVWMTKVLQEPKENDVLLFIFRATRYKKL